MLFMAFISWWFGPGWLNQVAQAKERLARVSDTFSITLLLGTLFSPFRQISAGNVSGPLGVKFQAWLDKLVSRLIGAMVRSAMIVVGIGSLVLFGLIGLMRISMWPLLPLLPIIFVLLAIFGWVPWQR